MNPDMTPPSSKTSTPLRPQTSSHELPPSPSSTSKAPHPLRLDSSSDIPGPAANGQRESDDSRTASEASPRGEDSEDGMDVEPDLEFADAEEAVGEVGVDEEMDEADGVGEGEAEEAAKGKGKAKAKTGKRRTKQPASARKRPTAGRKAKENELYETDIVERWNSDIGDIIADQRKARHAAPAAAATAAPATPPAAPTDTTAPPAGASAA